MDIESLKTELRSLGFAEDKINQLLDIAMEDALDTAVEDLEAVVDDATMEELAKMMEVQPTNAEDALNRVKVIFEKAYGLNAEAKKVELVGNYLKEVIEETKKAKDLYARYQAGDPAAVAQIKAQEGNPDVQAIVDQMK